MLNYMYCYDPFTGALYRDSEPAKKALVELFDMTYGEGGTTDTYQCISYYALFGYGASEVAQVENLHSGTVISLR